jgi:hypothetical protein
MGFVADEHQLPVPPSGKKNKYVTTLWISSSRGKLPSQGLRSTTPKFSCKVCQASSKVLAAGPCWKAKFLSETPQRKAEEVCNWDFTDFLNACDLKYQTNWTWAKGKLIRRDSLVKPPLLFVFHSSFIYLFITVSSNTIPPCRFCLSISWDYHDLSLYMPLTVGDTPLL